MRKFNLVSKQAIAFAALFVIAAAAIGGRYFAGSTDVAAAATNRAPESRPASAEDPALQFVELTEKQAGSLRIGTVELRSFEMLKTAVGTIDFNENRQQGGWSQIVARLEPGELVVTDGAVFLSNKLLLGADG